MDIGKTFRDRPDRCLRQIVIWIRADEKVITGIADGRQIVFQHARDHLMLMP